MAQSQMMSNRSNAIWNFFLITIVAIYELQTNALWNFMLGGKENVIDADSGDEHLCKRKIKLAEYDQLPIVFLNSFPGSGNT